MCCLFLQSYQKLFVRNTETEPWADCVFPVATQWLKLNYNSSVPQEKHLRKAFP